MQGVYIISQPQIEDAEALTAMHGESWLDTYPNDEHGVSREFIQEEVDGRGSKEGIEKRRRYIKESYTNPDYFFRIAKNSEGKVVGFIDGRKGEEDNELCGLYIAKSEYGTGLAKQLCEGILEWFGYETDIYLTVVTYNARAQAFYRKIGFEMIPGTEHFHNETVIPVVDMIRKGVKSEI